MATWNCAGAFRLKVERAVSLGGDITLVQEAEDPRHYLEALPPGGDTFWYARPRDRKGVLAFTRPGFTLRRHRAWLREAPFNHFIPIKVATPGGRVVNLFQVWTLGAARRQSSYVGQAHEALDYYERLLRRSRRRTASGPDRAGTVLAGDFNSNAYWDGDRRRNHTLLVDRFAAFGIHSAYHSVTGESHGAERQPTFYLYRKIDKPYHLDYCFTDLPVRDVEVGTYADWSGLKNAGGVSDHVPVVTTIDV